MKTLFFLIFGFIATKLTAQTVAFAADKMNVLYIGVDNAITIVAEGTDCSKLKVVSDNGAIEGTGCKLMVKPINYGIARITATYRIKGKTKHTLCNFRVIEIPPPVFKIGNGQRRMPLVALKGQQYVRAELETFPLDVRFSIDSFTVSVFLKETSTYKEVKNIGNKISDEVKQLFESLKLEDEILFKDIFSHKFNGEVMVLEPVLMRVY